MMESPHDDVAESILNAGPLRPHLKWMKAKDLTMNPHNWRLHPETQKQAVREFVKEVGWAGVLLYNETTHRLIDGHLRKAISDPDEEVPVLVGAWTEDQERKILAVLDPLGSMAEQDDKMFAELARDLEFTSHDLMALVEEQMTQAGEAPGKVKEGTHANMDALALRPQEHYDYVLVLATTYGEWAELCDLLDLKVKPRGESKIGFGRGVRAKDLIARLKGLAEWKPTEL